MGDLVVRGLTGEGHHVEYAENGVDALIAVQEEAPNLVIIDVMLPGMSGFEVCRRIRETNPDIGLLLLTARSGVEDRVFGLDAGADDYLTKPFAFAELNARVRALLRRDSNKDVMTVAAGPLRLDTRDLSATVNGGRVAFSPKEFVILRLLAEHLGAVVTRQQILEEAWGMTEFIDQNIVDQYVSYLRRKLGQNDAGLHLVTVRGKGYILELD